MSSDSDDKSATKQLSNSVRNGCIRFQVAIAAELNARLKRVCKRHGLKITEVARAAITKHIATIEEEDRLYDEKLEAERQKKKYPTIDVVQPETPTKFGGFKKLSNAIFTPFKKPGSIGKQDDESETASEYDKHAQKIFEAMLSGSTMEVRLCTAEAVEAIKKRYPLTHPPDEAIIVTLEKLVVEKRNAVRQEVPEQIIDVSKTKTRRGNVDVPPPSSSPPSSVQDSISTQDEDTDGE